MGMGNKYQKEFDILKRLCPLDNRETTCFNYGYEQGKIDSNKDFNNLLKVMEEVYPKSKAEYIDFDIFVRTVMARFIRGNE